MGTIKITITYNTEVDEQRIKDLLCNAFEGGSNYWYVIKTFNYPEGQTKQSLGLEFPHLDLPFVAGGSITVADMGDFGAAKGEMPDKVIDRDALIKGLQLMAEKYPRHFADFIEENDDADTGDVFLQLCCFGDIIFG